MEKNKRVKRYSKIYKKNIAKHSVVKTVFLNIFLFIFIATISYLSVMALNAYLRRPHCTHIGVIDDDVESDEITSETNVVDNAQNVDSGSNIIDVQLNAVEIDLKTLLSKSEFNKFLKQAVEEGRNALIICLKNTDGKIKYESNLDLVEKWKTGEKSKVNFKEIVNKIKQEGFIPIARMSAFFDQTAPSVKNENSFVLNKSNKVNVFSKLPTTKSGKWLNASEPVVRSYITQLAVEITDFGFEYILFDNVYFPLFETKNEKTSFKNITAEERSEVLSNFIFELQRKGVNSIFSYPAKVLFDDELAEKLFGDEKFIWKYFKNQAPIFSNESEYEQFIKNFDKMYTNVIAAFDLSSGKWNKNKINNQFESTEIKSILILK